MSIEVESHTEGLPLPAITICNKTGFKNSQRNLEINAYLENTLDESDFLIAVKTLSEFGFKSVQAGPAGHIVTLSFEIVNAYIIFIKEKF